MSAPTGALAVLGRRRRVIDDATTPEHETAPWVTGVLAALQAALLSFAVVVLPAVAVYVATSAAPGNESTSWPSAVGVGAAVWLLGHGVPIVTAGSVVSIVPLGIAMIAVLACYASARRTARRTWSALGAAAATYAVVVVLVVLLAGFAGLAQLGSAVLGGLAVVGLGAGAAILGTADRPDASRWWATLDRVPAALRLGVRAGLAATAMIVLVATLVVLAWIFMGRSRSMDVVTALDVSGFDAAAFALAQSTLVGNVVVWAVAWIAGPGFAVGAGSHFAPTDVVMGPMPVLPVLGAMPAESLPGALWLIGPALVAVAGGCAALIVRRATPRWRDVGLGVLATGLTAGVVSALVTDLAGGSAGPGRMAQIGAEPLTVGLVVGGEVMGGAALVLVLAHPATRRGFLAAWRRATRRAEPEPADPEPASARTASTSRTTPSSRTVPSPPSALSTSSAPSVGSVPSPPSPSEPTEAAAPDRDDDARPASGDDAERGDGPR